MKPFWVAEIKRSAILLLFISAVVTSLFAESPVDPNVEALGAGVNRSSSVSNGKQVVERNVDPFTHVVFIPAGADPASIRLSHVKLVRVPTRLRAVSDLRICSDQPFRDPGGSMYCPCTEFTARELAYEVTYSYSGPPLASDEYGNTRFSFRAYFRPESLTNAQWSVLAKIRNRAELATYFQVSASHPDVQEWAIDEGQSSFCAGYLQDGVFTRSDANCRDQVKYHRVSAPSDYLRVHVELASAKQPAAHPVAKDQPVSSE